MAEPVGVRHVAAVIGEQARHEALAARHSSGKADFQHGV
jgi:hypothetical protein